MEFKFEDAKLLTEDERENLSWLMYLAFCDLRALMLDGKTQQAKDLVDAFHNIPLHMYKPDFSVKFFRDLLDGYQKKYADKSRFDYLQAWEKLNTAAQ
jgi:hypothetical protein